MRILESLFIKIFSLIIFVLSLILFLVGLDIISYEIFSNFTIFLFSEDIIGKVTIVVSLIFMLVSLKIFLTGRGKPKNGKDGIVLENSSGKLIISRESLDNLIFNAAKDIPGAENISSKTYLDLEQNLRVFVTVTISQDISIKELSTKLQSRIKSAIKQTADLEVSEVNVKIKNILNKKSRRIKDSYEEKIPTNAEIQSVPSNNIEILPNEFNNFDNIETNNEDI